MATIRAGLNVDEFASCMTTQEEEYKEIETFLKESLSSHEFVFRRDFPFQELMKKKLDLFIFDYGGLCSFDLMGTMRERFARHILTAAKEMTNTLFIPWSKMTLDYWSWCANEFFPELIEEPNVWIPDPGKFYEDFEKEGLRTKLKEWFQ